MDIDELMPQHRENDMGSCTVRSENVQYQIIHRPIYFVKHWKEEKVVKDNTINPDTTEAVMKNIRGIPFLIQVRFSMRRSSLTIRATTTAITVASQKQKKIKFGKVWKCSRECKLMLQAIQYSMEATYYRDVLSEMGEGVVRTSVIHTAPGCTSILDSESEDEKEEVKITPRNSAEEQWLPFGESWRNEQLRLSLERGSSNLLV
ncbi:hypothetical protein OSTOST_15246, partial [Ostertagia ostertagi]